MLSCEVQLARPDAGNFDHWPASCCFAFCSSFTQLFIDWSTVRPVAAATSSLQLREMSKFGTPSATVTTICELKTIIEKEIGISRLLRIAAKVSGSRSSKLQRSLPQNRAECDGNVLQAAAGGRRDGKADPARLLKRNRASRRVGAFLTAGLEQEPGPALGLVDEDFEQACAAGILMIVAKLVGFAHRRRHLLVVFHQFAQHFARRHVFVVVILDGLMLGDLSDRAQRGAAELAYPLGELVGGGENGFRLLVQHQVIIVEMPAADMPVEVFGLHVEREGIRQQ